VKQPNGVIKLANKYLKSEYCLVFKIKKKVLECIVLKLILGNFL